MCGNDGNEKEQEELRNYMKGRKVHLVTKKEVCSC